MSNLSNYFSSDYTTARQKFLRASQKAGARLYKLAIDDTGPNSEILTIDIAWRGSPNPKRLIIHTSGLHGVEGFTGSAIQIKALENLPNTSDDGAIVFVHALNPYGMAWLRRFNENNVDLNRNFLRSKESWSGASDGYQSVNNFLNPKSPPSKDFFYLKLVYNVLKYGYRPLKTAIASGQYEYPKGIFFGGKQPEQGPKLYKSWLENTFSFADHIFVIDVHTGLGTQCQESLFHRIEGTKYSYLSNVLQKPLIRDYKKSDVVDYKYRGGHFNVFKELFPDSKIDFITQEFGTVSIVKVLYALREENRYHHYGEGKLDHPAKKRLKNAFYPDSVNWKASVLQDGISLIYRSLESVFK